MNEKNFNTTTSNNEKDVIAFYDDYASSWDSRFELQKSTDHFIKRRYNSFNTALSHCKLNYNNAVELGVGTGVYIDQTSKIFKSITAVDGSEKMLSVLNKKIKAQNLKGISLLQSDVMNLQGIKDSSADCIYFFGLIEHILDVNGFVKEIKRVLRNDGIVIGVTPNGSSPWYRLRRIFRGTGNHCSTDKYYTIDELNGFFISKGFVKQYHSLWGAVPAGIGGLTARLLMILEPILERTPLKKYLGGITFCYKIKK